MITYYEDGDLAIVDGLKFRRDKKTGYYLNAKKQLRLHRYMWERVNGKIPKGYHIHHINKDKSNNDLDNLELIFGKRHHEHHANEFKNDIERINKQRQWMLNNVMPKAVHWHKSKEGLEWHKKHYESMKDKLHQKVSLTCEVCANSYETTKANSRFCTNKCKSAHRRSMGYDNIIKNCNYCKNEFASSKYAKTKYCSRSCSNSAEPRLPQYRQTDINVGVLNKQRS